MTIASRFKAAVSALVVVSMLAGCKTYDSEGKANASAGLRGFEKPELYEHVLPGGSIKITPEYSVTYADAIMVTGVLVLAYYIFDPASPSWDILEKRFPDGRVQYQMHMRYAHIGGDGEARQVLVRRTAELAREQGKVGYQIRSFTESIDSRILLPRRTAEAEIVLLDTPEPPKPSPLDARPPLGSVATTGSGLQVVEPWH